MTSNKSAISVSEIGERNQVVGGAVRYRPLLAYGDGLKKRVSDTPIDGVRTVTNSNVQQLDMPLVNGKNSTVGRPRKQRNIDSDIAGVTPIQPKDRQSVIPISSNRPNSFDWVSYLKEVGASTVPVSHFTHVPTEIQNECVAGRSITSRTPFISNFTPDQCLEGIDPYHESLFCALKVVEVVGRRIRLRFIDYPEKYDFWTMSDSPFLFPVGWCAQNKRQLQPPKSYLDRDQSAFEWNAFLAKEKCTAAPLNLFHLPSDNSPIHMFRLGQKLEAVDKRNPGIACVATVKDVLGDYVLIHFDGWDSGFDQWDHVTSELLHPVGYCEDQELILSIPSEWSIRPTGFTWKQYLKETSSKPVPKEAFDKRSKSVPLKQQPQIGQRLEAVDRRCPQLIRVASILANTPHGFFTIAYDGWGDKFNVCLEASSSDLFPVGYCQATGHALQAPPGHDTDAELSILGDAQSNSSTSTVSTIQPTNCPTSGCKGYGHVKGPRYSYHQRISGCPYAEINLKKDFIRPHERLTSRDIASPAPDSTSLPQMPKLEQAVPNSSTPTTTATALKSLDVLPGVCHSPDSSVKTEGFPLSTTSSLTTSHSSSFTCTTSSVRPNKPTLQSTLVGINGTLDSTGPTLPHTPYPTDTPTNVCAPKIKPSSDQVSKPASHFLPLDLSLERETKLLSELKSGKLNTSSVGSTKQSIAQKMSVEEDDCDMHSVNLACTALDIATQQPSKVPSGQLSDTSTGSPPVFDSVMNQCTQLPDHPTLPVTAGSKRSLPDCSKPLKHEAKPRLSQLANAANEYARQQQLFGLTGLPVKRKRGRPRKYTTMNMFHTPPTNSRSSTLSSSVPHSRNSMPPMPFSYSTTIPGSQQPSTTGALNVPPVASSTVIPQTLSLYTPLTVGASLPGLYSAGLLLPGSAVSIGGTDQSHTVHSVSPLTWTADSNSTGGTVATSVSSQHSSSTEPATSRSPNCFDPSTQIPNSSQRSNMPSCLRTEQSSTASYDFCSTQPNNALGSCIDCVAGPMNLPISTTEVSASASSTLTYPGWCPGSVNGSVTPAAGFYMPTNVYVDPTRRVTSTTIDSTSNRSELDLLSRLLPQAGAALHASKVAGMSGPHSWNVDMVGNFVSTLPGCKQFASKFTDNEIDGPALMCLEQHDLMQILGMKLGPAVKVAGAIQTLRRSLMATPVTELGPDYAGAMAAAASCFNNPQISRKSSSEDDVDQVHHTSDSVCAQPGSASQKTVNSEKPVSAVV